MNIKRYDEIKKRLYFAGLRTLKDVVQTLNPPVEKKQIAFIFGCQRSGTTLLYEIFQKDFKAKVYPEFSALSDPNDPEGLRLKSLPEIGKIFSSNKVRLILAKPLVETQNADTILQNFPGSKAIWMYRNYKSVAKSNILHFGEDNGIKDLRPILQNENNNWRSEIVSDRTREIIQQHFSNNITPYDAAALFWYARNVLFYQLNLNSSKDVLLVRYEDMVKSPKEIIKKIYSFLNVEYPGDYLVKDIHEKALARGDMIELSPSIEKLCGNLYQRIEQDYERMKFQNYSDEISLN